MRKKLLLVAVMLTGAFSGYHAIFVFSAAISCVSLLLLAVIRLPRVKQPERPKKGFRLRDLVQLDAVPISCVIALVFFCYSGVGSLGTPNPSSSPPCRCSSSCTRPS